MMRLNVTLKFKRKYKAKCPRHPGYNPEQGRGAIRGGCAICNSLADVTTARDHLIEALSDFERLAEPYEVRKSNAEVHA